MLCFFFFFVNMLVTATVFPGDTKSILVSSNFVDEGEHKGERKRERERERDREIVCVCVK